MILSSGTATAFFLPHPEKIINIDNVIGNNSLIGVLILSIARYFFLCG
jgi:hypothetical protein